MTGCTKAWPSVILTLPLAQVLCVNSSPWSEAKL